MKKLLLAGATALAITGVGIAPARAQTTTAVANDTCPSAAVVNVGNNRPEIETQFGTKCVHITGGTLTFPVTSGTPCPTTTTANCSIPDVEAAFWASQAPATTSTQVTIATGGTAQNLFSGVAPPHGYQVCSPGADDIWLSETTTAVASAGYRVAGNGGCYSTEHAGGVVSAVGATNGDKMTVKEW